MERIGTGRYSNMAGVGRNWNIEERKSKRRTGGGQTRKGMKRNRYEDT